MEEKNRALVMRMMDGEEAAFDEIYRSCSGKLYRMAYFITKNRSDSEDILQETFVKCYLHRKELKNPERFDSWISQILIRTAWRAEKRRKRKQELSFDGILEDEEQTGMAERIRDNHEPEPLEQVLQTERFMELWKAVNHLDIKYRTVILLYYYNDFSTREIARITGTLEGTVKSRLYKARMLLKERLLAAVEADSGNHEGVAPETEKAKKRRLCHE